MKNHLPMRTLPLFAFYIVIHTPARKMTFSFPQALLLCGRGSGDGQPIIKLTDRALGGEQVEQLIRPVPYERVGGDVRVVGGARGILRELVSHPVPRLGKRPLWFASGYLSLAFPITHISQPNSETRIQWS